MQPDPLKLEVENLEGLPTERRELYSLDEATNRYRLNVDADPRKLLGALRNERDRGDAAERALATAAAERDEGVKAAHAERDAARAEAEAARALVLESRTREQCTLAGLHPSAINDALRVSREVFKVDAAGAVVARDGSKIDLIGWLHSTRESSPHWWPYTGSGSGAPHASAPSTTTSSSINRRAFEARSPAQRAALLHAGVTVTDH